ncbi:hypothetical protein ACYSNR_00925 [Enterococcus sp. LJL128]
MLDTSLATLEKIAVDSEQVLQLAEIGKIGIAPDFSQNRSKFPIQDQYALVTWLMSTPMTRMVMNTVNSGNLVTRRDPVTNDHNIVLPYTWGTSLPIDTAGECCWLPLGLEKCAAEAPMKLLCLRQCKEILDGLMEEIVKFKATDMINYFMRKGESIEQAKKRMAHESMRFFTARNIILGTTTTATATLKPFHGLLEILSDASVLAINGADILSAFFSLGCRLTALGGSNYVIAVHPITHRSIAKAIVPGRFGNLPDGWTKNGNEIRYNNIPFIQDKIVPYDQTNAKGDAWVLDGDTLGGMMLTDLAVTDPKFQRNSFAVVGPDEGCAVECDYLYNAGTTFSVDTNRLAVITDIPLDANCLGDTLQGLDGLLVPETLVPMG